MFSAPLISRLNPVTKAVVYIVVVVRKEGGRAGLMSLSALQINVIIKARRETKHRRARV